MKGLLVHKLLILWGVWFALTQALTIPSSRTESTDLSEIKDANYEPLAVVLEDRARGSRGGSRGSRRPKSKPKSKPRPKPKPKSKPKPKQKPKPKPTPKPKSMTKPKPTRTKPKSSATPKPSNAAVPNIAVPYKDTAVDLCGIYIDCDEYTYSGGKKSKFTRDIQQSGLDSASDNETLDDSSEHSLWKRAREVGGLKTLAYPDSSDLYDSPRNHNTKHVFQFKNNKLGSSVVRDSQVYNGNSLDYATEHILELQTIPMWQTWAKAKDPRLAAFFAKEWEKVQPTSRINARTKPSYVAAQEAARPQRETLSLLVFEAFGSTPNPDDFVLLENEINLAKAKVWSSKNVMAPAKFLSAYRDALKGARPSSDYLSAIRLGFGAVNYLNNNYVHGRMRNINANIRLELSNAKIVTGNNNIPNLVILWDEYIDSNFKKAEAKIRLGLKTQIDKVTPHVQESIIKYERMAQQLESQERTKGKQYLAQRKSKQKQLAAKLATEKRKTQRTAADLKALRSKKTKGMTDAQKDAHKQDVKDTKHQLFTAEKAEGLTQRAIHELYSPSCKKIVKNLKKDLMRLKTYEKRINSLTFRRL